MLTGHQVPQHIANNSTGAVQSSKPYFAGHIQWSVAVNTISRSLCCMYQVSHCHSNLVTTLSSCLLLTLTSVYNQNLTCSTPSSLSSFCSIPFILGKLKIKLTKNPQHHADQNGGIHGERTFIMVVRMGSILMRRISMEPIQRVTHFCPILVTLMTSSRHR